MNPNPTLSQHDEVPGIPGDKLHALMLAMSDLANSLEPGTFDGGQAGFAAWVADLATMMPYGDWCDVCAQTDDVMEHCPTRFPVAVGPVETMFRAGYRCHKCGHVWSCGWAVSAPWDLS
jgi:hypothetical protein